MQLRKFVSLCLLGSILLGIIGNFPFFFDIPKVNASPRTFKDLFLDFFPKWRRMIHAKLNVTDFTFLNSPWFDYIPPKNMRYYMTAHALACIEAYELTGNSTYLMEANFFIEYLDQYVDPSTESLKHDPSHPTYKGWFFHDVFMWMTKYKLDKLGYYSFDTAKVLGILHDYANLDNATDLAWSYTWTSKTVNNYVPNIFTIVAWFLSFLTNEGYADFSSNVTRIQHMADRLRATDDDRLYQYGYGDETTKHDYHYSISTFIHLACAKALDPDGINATRLEEVNQGLFNTTRMSMARKQDAIYIVSAIFAALAADVKPPCYPYLTAWKNFDLGNIVPLEGCDFRNYGSLTGQFYRAVVILGMFPNVAVPMITGGQANRISKRWYFNSSLGGHLDRNIGMHFYLGGASTGRLLTGGNIDADGIQWNSSSNRYYWKNTYLTQYANETLDEYATNRNASFNGVYSDSFYWYGYNGLNHYIYASNGTEFFIWNGTSYTSPAGWVSGNWYTVSETWVLLAYSDWVMYKYIFDSDKLRFQNTSTSVRLSANISSYQMYLHQIDVMNHTKCQELAMEWVQGTISAPSEFDDFQVDISIPLNIEERYRSLSGLTFYTTPTVVTRITSTSYDSDKLYLTISAQPGQTSTTKIYCGDKGEPTSVEGADSWTYDPSTNICTITVTHSNTRNVIVSWVPVQRVSFYASGLDSSASETVLVVDGENYTYADLPKKFEWEPGESHRFKWNTPIDAVSGKRFVWVSTSGLSPSKNDSILVPSGKSFISASYKTQYYLTVISTYGNPNPTSSWFDAGTSIEASVSSPVLGIGFIRLCSGWTGTGSVPYSGTDTSVTFTLDAPSNITWRWKTAQLSLSCSSSTSFVGFKVEIHGNLKSNGVGLSGAPIRLFYSVTGGESWEYIIPPLVYTGSDGSYSAVWMPSATRNYLLRATWAGNATYPEMSMIVNLAVMPYEEQNVFSVVSNSTVSNFAFNTTSRVLSFTVTGPENTTGYVNMYLAKAVVEDTADVKVYLDGDQLDYTATSTDDSWLLHFTYQHSTHKVTVSLGQASAPFIETPLGIAAIFSGIIGAIVALFLALRRRKVRR